MKDSTDSATADLFGEKRPRGRPKTGTAKTRAELQAAYRARQKAEYLTIKVTKLLAQALKNVQMQAVKSGASTIALTPLLIGELLKAIRIAEHASSSSH